MENKTIHYSSSLSLLLDGYVKEKRAVGYKFDKGAEILKQLDNLLIRKGVSEEILTKKIVLLWTEKRATEAHSTRNARISLIKGLAEYMNRLGYKAYVYPEKAVPISRFKYTPYIFSEKELAKFFDVADKLPSFPVSPYPYISHLQVNDFLNSGTRIV